MSFTARQRRQAFDNIASGSATGVERTNTDTVSANLELYGGGLSTSTSNQVGGADQGHTNIAAGTSTSNDVIENIAAGAVVGTGENPSA